MKRIGAILLSFIMVSLTVAPVASAAGFEVKSTSPKDGETGVPIENIGVKVFFSEEVYSKDNEKENQKACKIIDPDGKEIGSTLLFNEKDKKVALVLVDSKDKDGKAVKIQQESDYKLVIDKSFKSAKGEVLGQEYSVTFKTINQSTSMKISMGMMALMVVGIIIASSRAMKKEKKDENSKKNEKVNPYKVAKQTGKSVEDVVASDKKKKAKEEAARMAELDDDYYDDEDEEVEKEKAFKVKKPTGAGELGSKFVKKTKEKNAKKALIEAKIKASKKGKGKNKK